MLMDQSLYTIEDVCNFFKCSKSTVWRWVALGSFPKPLKFGGTSRWTNSAVSEFIRASELVSSKSVRPAACTSSRTTLRRAKLSSR